MPPPREAAYSSANESGAEAVVNEHHEPFPPGPGRRRAANSPQKLAQQILRELARLSCNAVGSEDLTDAFHLIRSYLAHAQAIAWKAVVLGTDLLGPRNVLEALQPIRPFIDQHYPDLEPKAQLAIEIETIMAGLLTAEDALERLRTEREIKDVIRSALEHAVLRVLVRSQQPLRSGSVHGQLALAVRPSRQWVGQLLQRLSDDGYLNSSQGRAQGNPKTAFYSLTSRGQELCKEIGVTRNEDTKRRQEIVTNAMFLRNNNSSSPVDRGLADGVISVDADQHRQGQKVGPGHYKHGVIEECELVGV